MKNKSLAILITLFNNSIDCLFKTFLIENIINYNNEPRNKFNL